MKSIPWDGKKITKPGMYSGIPLETYHGDICDGPSVSTSGLKTIFDKSPAHFFETSYLNPNRGDVDESSALILGRAIHHLILGEPNFQQFFCEEPAEYEVETGPDKGEMKKWNNNANPCKRWNSARAAENKYVLTKKEILQARGIANSLASHELVQQGILNGLVERSLFWKDKKTGIWLKLRPDVIPTDSGDSADLKTCESVDWEDLQRSLYNYGYYQQGAMNRTGMKAVLDIDLQSFTLFFVEKKPPNCVRPVIIKDIDLDIGAQCNRAALDTMAECLKTGKWWGPRSLTGEVIEHMEMSVWQKNSICAKLRLMNYDTPDYEGKAPHA